MNISEVLCKSVLVKSRIYGVDYAVNPYTGCEHNCVYCYATFMKRYTNHREPWGEFVDVKINAPTVLRKQVRTTKRGRVLFSSVTDAYQPVEARYELTRTCLQLLPPSFFISVLTKSPLVLRDLDILQERSCEVGFTITTLDDRIRRVFEPNSPRVEERLRALKVVHESGVQTYAFFGPIIPFLSDSEESIRKMFELLHDHVSYVIVDRMNLYDTAWRKIRSVLSNWRPELIPHYEALKEDSHYDYMLKERISGAATVPVDICF